MLDKATPRDKVSPSIERLAVVVPVVINPVPTVFEIVAKHFILLAKFSVLATLPKK